MRRWILKEDGPVADPASVGTDGPPRLVRRLLRSRGIDGVAPTRRWLNPALEDRYDPSLLSDLDRAVARVDEALRRDERILVFGDYDVDGITSAAILKRYLDGLGGAVRVRIPQRLSEGYGLSIAAVDEAHAWGASLILTADCGTTAVQEIAHARRCGIDVVVLDHHIPGPVLPEAVAIVNPHREESRVPFRDLAAVGVTSKLLEGIHRLRRGGDATAQGPEDLLDLTALGTIADGMPMIGENRILVRQGLRLMRASPRPALAALASASGLNPRRIRSSEIAFQMVPRLNAAGRLGDSNAALDLLLSDDPERCRVLASTLDAHNSRRRELLDKVVRESVSAADVEQAAHRGEPIVLVSDRWHPGVVGIAASRIAERFRVPAILLASDGAIARGSGRSAGDYDLLELVRAASGGLLSFGGHRSAVGLTLEAAHFPRFRDEILVAARTRPVAITIGGEALQIDARAAVSEIDRTLLDWLDRFEPFGPGNEEPVLAVRGRIVGGVRVLKEKHLRFDLGAEGERRECIGFGLAEHAARLEAAEGDVHFAVVASRNVWNGEERLQLQVRDIAFADPFGNV